MKDLCSYQTIGSTRPRYTPLDYPFTLVWFANNTALILPPETDQRRSEISPLATPEAFTQRRRRRIPACEWVYGQQWQTEVVQECHRIVDFKLFVGGYFKPWTHTHSVFCCVFTAVGKSKTKQIVFVRRISSWLEPFHVDSKKYIVTQKVVLQLRHIY